MSLVLDNALSTNYALQGGYPMPGRNLQIHIKQSLEPLKQKTALAMDDVFLRKPSRLAFMGATD
jgi:hypothetical protein